MNGDSGLGCTGLPDWLSSYVFVLFHAHHYPNLVAGTYDFPTYLRKSSPLLLLLNTKTSTSFLVTFFIVRNLAAPILDVEKVGH